MKLRTFLVTSIVACSFSLNAQSTVPLRIIRPDTPSLEAANDGAMSILRTPHEPSGTVRYEIRFYESGIATAKRLPEFSEVVLVLTDPDGNLVMEARLDISRMMSNLTGMSTLDNQGTPISGSGSKDDRIFTQLEFTIHKSLEPNALVNIGRSHAIRTVYQEYRLPQRSIILQNSAPNAEQGAAGQPATRPLSK
jgi:hypothetical protein